MTGTVSEGSPGPTEQEVERILQGTNLNLHTYVGDLTASWSGWFNNLPGPSHVHMSTRGQAEEGLLSFDLKVQFTK